MDDEIASQIETIESTLIKDSVLGFDPTILSILDNVESGQDEIENLKSRLGARSFHISLQHCQFCLSRQLENWSGQAFF